MIDQPNKNHPPVLELRDVRKTYMVSQGVFRGKEPLDAIQHVNLSLSKGDVLGVVGESGCGKSTLAKILLGLELPSSGEVLVDGELLGGHDRKYIARRIQPVFQDPYSSLNPRKTIAEIISLPMVVHGTAASAQAREKRVEKMLDLVGLPQRVKNSYPSQMSGGQRQRVAIARALVIEPEVLVCDEPTSALDVSVQSQILNLLLDLRSEMGLTYLFISHDLAVVEHLASRVAVMYLGRIVEEARTARIFEEARHPYTRALLNSVLTPEPGRGIPDTHLGTSFPNPINPPSGCRFHPRCEKAFAPCYNAPPVKVSVGSGKVECHLWDENFSPANREAGSP